MVAAWICQAAALRGLALSLLIRPGANSFWPPIILNVLLDGYPQLIAGWLSSTCCWTIILNTLLDISGTFPDGGPCHTLAAHRPGTFRSRRPVFGRLSTRHISGRRPVFWPCGHFIGWPPFQEFCLMGLLPAPIDGSLTMDFVLWNSCQLLQLDHLP